MNVAGERGRPVTMQRVARYLAWITGLNLAWEVVQLPLYTLWRTADTGDLAYAVLHCTLGDLAIGAGALGAAWLVVGRPRWPEGSHARVVAWAVGFGVAYTIFSEWLNVEVRGTWQYAAAMPRVPLLGTGLTPLLQWLLLPPLAFSLAARGGTGRERSTAHAPSLRRAACKRHVAADLDTVFGYLDDPGRLGAHMQKGGAMMAGARMQYEVDTRRGLGQRIVMRGRVLGLPLFVSEEVVEHVAPSRKTWQTTGVPRLWVIGRYRMGFALEKRGTESELSVFLDYELPAGQAALLGALLGPAYARWCVTSIADDAARHFAASDDT
jgi:hypothetical protein